MQSTLPRGLPHRGVLPGRASPAHVESEPYRRLAAGTIVASLCLMASAAYAQRPEAPGSQEPRPDARQAAPAPSGVRGPLILEGAAASNDEGATESVLTSRRVTVRRTEQGPTIDGRIDDAVWRTATRITEFVQQRPLEGTPATEQTEVYLAYDSQRIYFGVYAHYSDPKLIRANRVARDQIGRDDRVQFFFDPFLDAQRAYVFSVNGYGVQGDRLMGGGGGGFGFGGGGPGFGGGDTSWDALFASAGTLVQDGWTAELAIPFKSLRYPSRARGEAHRWGFQIERNIESKNESVVWSPVSREIPGMLRQLGTLEGMTNLSTSRNLEILPSFTAVQVRTLDTTTGTYGTSGRPEGGLNLKYGFTPTLVADFAVNPDFSQIESDRQQIEVNQRFPVFYPELRPSFLEGQEIFQVQGPATFVHTRTIVDPQYVAKVTGKTRKTSLGILLANDEAPGHVAAGDPLSGAKAQVFLGRVRYDVYSESHLGAIFTDRELVNSHSRLAGIDGSFRFRRNYRLSFGAIFSDRQDLQNVHRSGPSFNVNFNMQGRHLGYGISHNEIHPDFGTDLGFVRRVNQKQTSANISYRWYPENWITNWGPRLNYERNFTYAGVKQDGELGGGVFFQFARNIAVNTNIERSMERFRDVDFHKTRFSVNTNVNTSRKVSFGVGLNGGDQVRYVGSPFLGKSSGYGVFTTLRPVSRLQSEITVNRSHFTDVRTNTEVFDIKIFRAQTTYQLTDRLTVRNILDHNTYDRTFGANLLMTYRVNSGTVFYVGYDDRYRDGSRIDPALFPTTALKGTNRAVFTKLQYLFRY